jgi:sec-independent protein translocase protein TatA
LKFRLRRWPVDYWPAMVCGHSSGVCCENVMFCEFQDKEEFMFEGLLQPTHLLVIFGIALLVFGPKKLPELGKGIGEGIRGLRSAMKEREEPLPAKIINPPSSSGPQ